MIFRIVKWRVPQHVPWMIVAALCTLGVTAPIRAEEIEHSTSKSLAVNFTDGLSPDEAAVLAVMGNPTLRALRDRHEVSSAQLIQAGILPNPVLAASMDKPVGNNATGKTDAFEVNLGWNVTSLIARNARTDVARINVSAVDLEVTWQEWQVAEAARLHAFRVILIQKKLVVAGKAVTASEEIRQSIRQSLASGLATVTDLSDAERALREAQSNARKIKANLQQEQLALNRALGVPPEAPIHVGISGDAFSSQTPLSTAALVKHVEKRRPDLLALKQASESQDARLRAAVRSRFPKVRLMVRAGRDTDHIETVGAGIGIDLPVFDRRQGAVAEQRATQKELMDEYDARLFEAHADIARLVADREAVHKQLAATDDALSSLKALAGGNRVAAETGQASVLSYYKTRSNLYREQMRKSDLEQSAIDLRIALEIASGRYDLATDSTNQEMDLRLGELK